MKANKKNLYLIMLLPLLNQCYINVKAESLNKGEIADCVNIIDKWIRKQVVITGRESKELAIDFCTTSQGRTNMNCLNDVFTIYDADTRIRNRDAVKKALDSCQFYYEPYQ